MARGVAAPAVVVLLVLALGACARKHTAATPAPPLPTTTDPGSAGALVRAADGADRGFAAGWTEGVFDSLASRGEVCARDLELADVQAEVLRALRAADPAQAGIGPASDAIRSAWPCSELPIITIGSPSRHTARTLAALAAFFSAAPPHRRRSR